MEPYEEVFESRRFLFGKSDYPLDGFFKRRVATSFRRLTSAVSTGLVGLERTFSWIRGGQ